MNIETPRLSLRFFGERRPQATQVPASVLAEALTHAQKAVHLLALTAMGREFKERLRVPAEIANEFVVVCELPTVGSYDQPITIAGTGALLDVPSRAVILEQFSTVGSALSQSDWGHLRAILPDQVVRQRIVDEFVGLLPSPETGYGMEMRHDDVVYAAFTPRQVMAVHEYQRRTREPSESPSAPITVTGELVRIDFGGRKITIRHYPTNRMLDCEYTDEIEEMLLANRRGLIQVAGLVERDRHDRPTRLTNVFDIRELDLSPISLEFVSGATRKLRFVGGAHQFAPALDDEGQLLVVEDADLDLHAYSSTRSGLIAEITEQLEFLWVEFAEATEELTPSAAALAQRLHSLLEVGDA